MQHLDIWFVLAVLLYVGAISLMWRFWHPVDPLAAAGRGAWRRRQAPHVPERPFLLDGEHLLQQGPASLYRCRSHTQWVGGAAAIAGGGWLGGLRRNRPGYSYEQTGTLWLTNRRLVFLGQGVSLSVPLGTILQVHDDGHWLIVWAGGDEGAHRWRLAGADRWRQQVTEQVTGHSAA